MKDINFRDKLITTISENVNTFHDNIVNKAEVGVLPETLFKEHFLPFFSGDKLENVNEVLADWVKIAGTPMSEVTIIDDTGNKLFNVPALMNTNILDVVKPVNQGGLDKVFVEYTKNKGNILANPENTLNNMLNTQFKARFSKENFKDADDRWRTIVERYKKPQENNVINDSGNDELIYE